MRALPFACSLSFVVLTGATFAQPDAQLKDAAAPLATPAPATAGKANRGKAFEEARARGIAWFEQCMQDWDAQTHMTKKEWQTTCRRVAEERARFLYDQTK
jgi:hypothetical protein